MKDNIIRQAGNQVISMAETALELADLDTGIDLKKLKHDYEEFDQVMNDFVNMFSSSGDQYRNFESEIDRCWQGKSKDYFMQRLTEDRAKLTEIIAESRRVIMKIIDESVREYQNIDNNMYNI